MHTLGTVLPSLGDYAPAEATLSPRTRYYREVAKDDHKAATASFQLGVLYCSWYDYWQCGGLLQAVVGSQPARRWATNTLIRRASPPCWRWSMLASAATSRRRNGAKEALASRAAKSWDRSTRKRLGLSLALGNIYLLQGKLDQAEEQLQAVLASGPDETLDERYRNAISLEKLGGDCPAEGGLCGRTIAGHSRDGSVQPDPAGLAPAPVGVAARGGNRQPGAGPAGSGQAMRGPGMDVARGSWTRRPVLNPSDSNWRSTAGSARFSICSSPCRTS